MKRYSIAAVLALLLAGSGAATLWLATPDTDLLHRSRLLLPIWDRLLRWSSANSLEYIDDSRAPGAESAWVLNVATGARNYSRPFSLAERVWWEEVGRYTMLSPDGAHRLSTEMSPMPRWAVYTDGEQPNLLRSSALPIPAGVWPPWHPSAVWHADGLGFAILFAQKHGWRMQSYDLASTQTLSSTAIAGAGGPESMELRLLGFSEPNRAVISTSVSFNWDDLLLKSLATIDTVTGRIVSTKGFTPPEGTASDLFPDPRPLVEGHIRRIAWALHRRISPPRWREWLHRLMPFFSAGESREAEELWTTSLDGTDWRLVGGVDAPSRDDIGALKPWSWSPDGRSIVFWYKEQLRIIAVPRP